MDDVWFGSDLTHRDVESILQSLSLQGDRQSPLIAVADGGATLVLASRALFRFFEVEDAAALSDRLLAGCDPGARRLAFLCRNMTVNGAPRLERLRFFISPAGDVVTFLCRRIALGAGEPLFVAAALGLRIEPSHVPAPVQMPDAPPALDNRPGSADADEIEPVAGPAFIDPEPETQPMATVTSHQPSSSPDTSSAMLAGAEEGNGPPSVAGSFQGSVVVASGVSTAQTIDATSAMQATQAMLRSRWPSERTRRFLWQTNADRIFTQLTPQLAEVVGTSDLVGTSFVDLAPRLDPDGRLGAALDSKANWSGLDVWWPIASSLTAIEICLGGVPAFDRERAFEGYRGYGVIRLDRVRPDPLQEITEAPHVTPPAMAAASVSGSNTLSPEDHDAFEALGAELRDHVSNGPVVATDEPSAALDDHVLPLVEPGDAPSSPQPVPATDAISEPVQSPSASVDSSQLAMPGEVPEHDRAADVARNGIHLLDRLAVAVLVSRANVPIFANRHFLDLTGFADEDSLHAAGGMAHLFGGMAGNVVGAEAVGIRARDGTIIPATALMQRIDWDCLPATLLTLQSAKEPPASAVAPAAVAPAMTPGGLASRDEEELRDLRAILETAADGVAVLDDQYNVMSLNRSGEALFGCDRHAVIGKPFLDMFAVQNQGLASEYLEGLKTSATKVLLNDGREFLLKGQQGTIPVFMTLGRLGDPADATSAPRFCALFRDLTPWKKVEHDLQTARQEAERASALKSDFLASVTHEIRTPLNAIIGFADVMIEERLGPLGSPRYKEYLHDIHASGTHVMSLVNDLLDLSKIEAGKLELSRNPLDVNKIIGESVALMQPQANRERVIMRLSLAPHLPQIRADDRSLRQIVINLLSNAVKYNEPGGQVIASTLTEDGHVVIRVRDTGPGMSEGDLAAALEPFRRLSTARPAAGGTGLGLPLTKALVEANEAKLTIRSKLDHGTMIEVSFPPNRVLASHGNA